MNNGNSIRRHYSSGVVLRVRVLGCVLWASVKMLVVTVGGYAEKFTSGRVPRLFCVIVVVSLELVVGGINLGKDL